MQARFPSARRSRRELADGGWVDTLDLLTLQIKITVSPGMDPFKAEIYGTSYPRHIERLIWRIVGPLDDVLDELRDKMLGLAAALFTSTEPAPTPAALPDRLITMDDLEKLPFFDPE